MTADPSTIGAIMAQLSQAFPGHTVTLVLRCPDEPDESVISTTDPNCFASSAMLAEFALKHFQPEAMHS